MQLEAKGRAAAKSRRLFEPRGMELSTLDERVAQVPKPFGQSNQMGRSPGAGHSLNLTTRRVLAKNCKPSPWVASRTNRYPETGERTRPERERRFMRSTPSPPGLLDKSVQYRKWNRDKRQRASHQTIMILPQVHLRKPCYDFYFLQAIKFELLLGQRCRRFHARPRPIRGPH